MMEEKFSSEQSLQLIQSMIDKTKQDISDNGIYFLVKAELSTNNILYVTAGKTIV